jgi:hypothetical protein
MASDRDAVSRRMRPGAWDVGGFLTMDESLAERIAADLATCRELGTDAEHLGRQMIALISAARPDGPVTVGPHRVTIRPKPDPITCPWAIDRHELCLAGPGGLPTADQFTIRRGPRSLSGLALSAHLIGIHRFFGGLDSRYRIDPARAYAVLAAG